MNPTKPDRTKEFSNKLKSLVAEYGVTLEVNTGYYGDIEGVEFCVDGKRVVGEYSGAWQFEYDAAHKTVEQLREEMPIATNSDSRIPHTADGFPIFLGDEVWFYEEDSSKAMSAQVTAIYAKSPVHGHVYPGKFVIGADWYEDGDSKFYHVRGSVPIPAV